MQTPAAIHLVGKCLSCDPRWRTLSRGEAAKILSRTLIRTLNRLHLIASDRQTLKQWWVPASLTGPDADRDTGIHHQADRVSVEDYEWV